MLKQQDVIQTLQESRDKYATRKAQVGLIQGVILDAKEFFSGLSERLGESVTSKTIKVDVQNQVELPKVQQIDGSVSLKDAKAILTGIEELRKAIKGLEGLATPIKKLSTDLKPIPVDFSTLEKAIRDIEIPETIIPEAPETVTISNLSEIKKYFTTVESAIKGIVIPETKIPSFPKSISISNFPEPEKEVAPTLLSFYWTKDKVGNLQSLVEVYENGEVESTGFNIGRVVIHDRRS